DRIHGRDHLIAADLGWSGQYGMPGPAGMVALIGMHLRVNGQHVWVLALCRSAGSLPWYTTAIFLFHSWPPVAASYSAKCRVSLFDSKQSIRIAGCGYLCVVRLLVGSLGDHDVENSTQLAHGRFGCSAGGYSGSGAP